MLGNVLDSINNLLIYMFFCNQISASSGIEPVRRRIVLLAALVIAAACAATAELNSERIERLYGNYHVDVLSQTAALRVSNLFSTGANGSTCRTLAIVRFAPGAAQDFSSAHATILRGASIGATLQATGWTVRKVTRHIGEFDVPTDASLLRRLMRLTTHPPLTRHVYVLQAARDGEPPMPYATIIEVHHPDYWSTAALAAHYAGSPFAPLEPEALAEIEQLTARAARGAFM